jgi:hypothetical protein
MAELNPQDRYQLRKLQLEVDKKDLETQKARQELERFMLELEHKYGLMDQANSIDPRVAEIRSPVAGRNGKGGHGPLLATGTDEAAT